MTSTPKNITFYSSCTPDFESGLHTFNAVQTVNYGPDSAKFPSEMFSFYIDGPKFSIDPGLIHQVHPIPSSSGNYATHTPAIVFNRITLPWERKGKGATDLGDWLCLFLIDPTDAAEVSVKKGTAKDLFSGVDAKYAEMEVDYIEIPQSLYDLIPQKDQSYLSHCRSELPPTKDAGAAAKTATTTDDKDHEKSVVIGNRLPRPGVKNTVYLLSLEQVVQKDGKYLVPYLHHWSFFCNGGEYLIPKGTTNWPSKSKITTPIPAAMINSLCTNEQDFIAAIKKEAPKITSEELASILHAFAFNGGSFWGLLYLLPKKLASFNYPIDASSLSGDQQSYLEQGAVVLKNNTDFSWYRGPLQAAPVVPIAPVDLYTGMQQKSDLSLAFAHQLGQLTALSDKDFNQSFYQWKQQTVSAIIHEEKAKNQKNVVDLSFHDISANQPMPSNILDKLKQWKNIQGLDYRYLIPSLNMVPNNSIRYFCIDVNWVNSFLLGALSVGPYYSDLFSRLIDLYVDQDVFLSENRYGVLIHSLIISGWPKYDLDVTFKGSTTYTEISKVDLAKNLQFRTFEGGSNDSFDTTKPNTDGQFKTLKFKLPHQNLHYGVFKSESNFTKIFKVNGTELSVPLTVDENGVIDLDDLIKKVTKALSDAKITQTVDPAFIGRIMLETAPSITFNIAST